MRLNSNGNKSIFIGFTMFVLLFNLHVLSANTYEKNMDFIFILQIMWMLLPLFIIPYGVSIIITIKGIKKALGVNENPKRIYIYLSLIFMSFIILTIHQLGLLNIVYVVLFLATLIILILIKI